jgi:hypothetical protein
MAKSTASQDRENTMTHLDFFKKFKRLNPLEPSLTILTFFLFTLLFITFFFYLDYDSVGRGITWLGLHGPLSSSSPDSMKVRPQFLDEGGDGCDVFDGNWVWDESYPLYQSQNCSFLDGGFRCTENGRRDSFYTKWRWQPKDCNLPRFYTCSSHLYFQFLLECLEDSEKEIVGKKIMNVMLFVGLLSKD